MPEYLTAFGPSLFRAICCADSCDTTVKNGPGGKTTVSCEGQSINTIPFFPVFV